MSEIPIFVKGGNPCFRVRLQPGASRDQVVGVQEGSLRIQISSPPIEGRANRRLIRFLAKALGVAKSQLEIVSGLRSREKTIAVAGFSEGDLSTQLLRLLKSL